MDKGTGNVKNAKEETKRFDVHVTGDEEEREAEEHEEIRMMSGNRVKG